MELPELEQQERVVLAAMVKYAVTSGAPIADEEAEEIDMSG